ncbi:MAG: hypothetical protein GSR78_02230 [Desulfurococcales archaeon]|nr:hypothetical protein [Desulfurococcales archaeon]
MARNVMKSTRKGLSPLVATVILISVTVLGGLMIYTYFQDSVDTMQGLSERLITTVTLVDAGTTRLAHIEAVNGYKGDITITGVLGIYPNGTQVRLPVVDPATGNTTTALNIALQPGEKTSLTAVISDPGIAAISVEYRFEGQTLTGEPAALS